MRQAGAALAGWRSRDGEWPRSRCAVLQGTLRGVNTSSVLEYSVVLEPDPAGGYIAVIPAFPGCYSQGDTVEEALANAREAILLTIEDMEAHGEPFPAPSGELIGKVEISR